MSRSFKPRVKKYPGQMSGVRAWKRVGSRAGGVAYRAYQGVKYLKSIVNVEKKFNDLGSSGNMQPLASAATVDWLTNIAQGTDYNKRDGISVKPASLFLRGTIELQGTAPVGTNVRHVLVLDKEGLGTAPTVTDLFEDTSYFVSPLNHINGKRFKVLMDRITSVSPQGPQSVHWKKFLKLNHHTRWSNTTTGTREGHLYMFSFADQYSAGVSAAVSTYYSRLRFIDN